ncbi:SCL-interrupting locus protein homolog isoform X1 [Rhipicephalus sanguineus]|uniref:SCL-interrupting locus protein homolog isoform X1 n=1 Tax=Rhipicephalus sanguineus TaxID=34632 RepID=UPI00189332C0|nr:SCL-interrupting locus protein homolog isoform X1 [Rhipicephalus sanguineus]
MEHSANKRTNANGECSSFLWNQLVSGAPVVLGLDAYRPPAVKIKEQVLNAAFRTALEKRAEQSVLSSLAGTVQFSAESDGIIIVLDQVPGCTSSPLRPNVIQVPCKFDKATQGNGITNSSKEEWLAKLMTFEDAWHYASLECGLGFSLAVTVDMAARIKGPSCDLTVSAVTPMLPLRLVPLFPIPVLRSGVQDTLSSPHAAALPDFGFVTLCGDHLCFHFKHQLEDGGLNFIGVWISGVASVEHPFIWLVCAQFVTSQRLASRPREIFVVCILSRPEVTALNVSFGKPPEEVLFFNCLCQSQTSLHFQLWQGAAVTSVARVPSASNKTIGINLEKVLSGGAAETFHLALKELVKNRVPPVASQEQNSSAMTRNSWVPTPKPARSQDFIMAPTVPDVSDCSMGLSVHSRLENASYGMRGPTCDPSMPVLNTDSQGGCFAQCSNAAQDARTTVTPTLGGTSTPLQSCGVQDYTVAATDAQFRLSQQQQYAPSASTTGRHAAPESVPVGVYELIRRQDEQLLELRRQIQRLLCPPQEKNQSGPPVLSVQPLASEYGKKNEKLTCNAGTMTEAVAQVVHRSVQTDKTTTESSSSGKGCSFCAHCKQEQRASEIPERDTDYTIFFPEKSPHLTQRLTQKPSPRTAGTIPHREPANGLPRPAYVHSKTSDLLMTPSVSFRDDPSLQPDRLEKRGAPQGAVLSSSTETFIHPRLQFEESRLSVQRRDELSFQVDRIAHKYCPEGAGLSASQSPLAKGGVPLSQDAQAYLQNYGLDSRRARDAVARTDSMERILDISALKRLPKLL